MYTQCPECLTIFEIDEETLQASLGIVHCGHCSKRFDALRSLTDTLPTGSASREFEGSLEAQVPTLTVAVSTPVAADNTDNHPSDPTAASDVAPPPSTAWSSEPAAPVSDATDSWLAGLHTDLTAELIAAAAGIPGDAVQATDDWQLTTDQPPVQARFTGLDIIPLTPEELAEIESGRKFGVAPTAAAPTDTNPEVAAESASDATEPAPDANPPALTETGEPQGFNADPGVPAEFDSAITPPVVNTGGDASHDAAARLDPGASAATPAGAEPAPVYLRPRRRLLAHPALWWSLGSLLLALILAAQLAWIERGALLRNPKTQPWIVQLCGSMQCRLPLLRDIAKLQLLSRDIRPDPRHAGALVITATLRNNAAFAQPWPVVRVELSDIDGNPVAMRRFRPAEYMPDAPRRARGIAPGATAAVAFEVADPGKRAVNFQFGFQ